MGFASTSVILWPKRAVKLVLAAQHNFFYHQNRFILPCYPQQFFCARCQHLLLVPSSFLMWALWLSQSFILSAFPTHVVKAAQYLSCHLPDGFHQVSFTGYHMAQLLSALQLCHLSLALWSSALEQQHPELLEREAAWLFSRFCCPGAAGQATLCHWEREASSALTIYTS